MGPAKAYWCALPNVGSTGPGLDSIALAEKLAAGCGWWASTEAFWAVSFGVAVGAAFVFSLWNATRRYDQWDTDKIMVRAALSGLLWIALPWIVVPYIAAHFGARIPHWQRAWVQRRQVRQQEAARSLAEAERLLREERVLEDES